MHGYVNVRLTRENPYVRPLEQARRAAGGDEELAAALSTSTEMLSTWLSGETPPPMKAYVAAMNLVARNRLRSRSDSGLADRRTVESAHANPAQVLAVSIAVPTVVVTARSTQATV
jgi:hypothetical protein